MPRQQIEDRVLIPRYIKGHIYEDCGRICTHCGKPIEFFGDFTLEHVIPISKGGTNDRRNLVALCEDCNKAKSNDIIPPIEYFGYLPEAKRQDLQAMFDEYVTSQDWLDYDNLFMTDWFTIQADRAMLIPKTGRIVFTPMELKVRRLREEDANQRIQDYRQYVSHPDSSLFVLPDEKLPEPYYEVEWNGKPLMFFTAYIADGEDYNIREWQYFLQFDYYFNPEIKHRRATGAPTIFNVINAILAKAQETLLNGSQGTVMLVRLRSPRTAPLACDISDFFRFARPSSVETFNLEMETRIPGNSIRCTEFIMFQGDAGQLKQLMKAHNATNMEELGQAVSKESLQASLTERLSASHKLHHRSRK